MSDLLATVTNSFHRALTIVQDVSARAPGTPTTQALVMGVLLGFVTYNLRKKRYRLPPGPWAWPFLGNIKDVASKEVSFYKTLKRWTEKYGPVISVYMGNELCVTLNNSDVVTEALVHKAEDFAGRPFLYSMHYTKEQSSDIIFTDYSPQWKFQRKIGMQAIRQYMRGKHLEEVVHSVVTMVSEKMEAEPGPFEPHTYNTLLIFHVVDHLCFGKPKPFADASIKYLIGVTELFNEYIGSGFLEDVFPLVKYWPTKKFKHFCDNWFGFVDYMERHIKEHKNTFSPNNVRDLTDSILLAQAEALRDGNPEAMAWFTETHLRQIVSDIYIAAVDTTRMTLDWALLFMAGNPEIQKRAQEEIDAASGDRLPGMGDRSRLQFTEAVLYEVMRLGPATPFGIPHKTLCDTTVGGYQIPKDTMVLVNLWAALRDPNTWDQPEEFKPERFLDDQGKLKSKPEHWVPFSAGRRVCMGESVARPELLLLLSCLLKRFTISLPEGDVFAPDNQVYGNLFNPPKPYRIIVTPR